jgi:hypothetical protein
MVDVIGFFSRAVFGFWDLTIWLVRTWCELIVSLLSIFGWLLAIAGVLILFTDQWILGMAAYALALAFMVGSEVFKLLDFWISDRRYTVPPEKFVGDVVGTVIGFVLVFGGLLAFWYFLLPEPWLLVLTVALAPISLIRSGSRILKNFLATMKDKLAPRPPPPQSGTQTIKIDPNLVGIAKDVLMPKLGAGPKEQKNAK